LAAVDRDDALNLMEPLVIPEGFVEI
jgi:hypothetical protein